ncbi:DUF427-domain-containing protein [Daedalea quercina L-15889]|uniref:DUF427-domain-containing protein n=1 Tax=Daedalea quercina L-15889 TaxID=1314783 RepID=A0A165TLG0_9APHY|nr:DUF427-domain-containing protein [Daedalea quercina L-15889]
MAAPSSQPRIENSVKRVRVLFGGKYVIDTIRAKLVWLKPNYPYYFFDAADVPEEFLHQASKSVELDTYDLVVGTRKAELAVTKYLQGDLAGLVQIAFGAVDAWFEEDEEIFVHPKDPYKRVDVLQSSRHVRVVVNGVEVANTTKPRLLFETGLPVRTYIPKTDVRMDLLKPTDLTTACPYKGVANYYSVQLSTGETFDNIIWWYRVSLPECGDIKGYVAFYDEKVDTYFDGVLQARPGQK